MKQEISAKELLFRLEKGERYFSELTIIGNFTWDSSGEPNSIKDDLTLSKMEFTGDCYLGDLDVNLLILEDSIFHQRCALYRLNARKIDACFTHFHRGLGLVHFSSRYADFRHAQFPNPPPGLPGGITIKKSRIQSLVLLKAESCQTTIDNETSIKNLLTRGAKLGRRTPTRLKELQAA